MTDTDLETLDMLRRIDGKLDRIADDLHGAKPPLRASGVGKVRETTPDKPDRLKELIDAFAALSPEEQAKSIAYTNRAILEGRL